MAVLFGFIREVTLYCVVLQRIELLYALLLVVQNQILRKLEKRE
jgi:hypothetical protein